jgi:hypothetical protein
MRSVIKIKSYNALLHVLFVDFIIISELRYKFLFLDAYHPDSIYLRQQGWEDQQLFFEYKRCPRAVYKLLIYTFSKGALHSSGLIFAGTESEENWMEITRKFTERKCFFLLLEDAVDMLRYAVCKQLLYSSVWKKTLFQKCW